ncbi:MAG: response regulator [Armatimonadetes bacterium]|nr:response regulator [Armatimonadota bacterium]
MSGLSLVVSELVPGAASRLVESLREHGPVQALGYAYDGLEAAQMAVLLKPDVLLAHLNMPGLNGLQACSIVSQAAPEVACALLAEQVDEATLAAAMRAGARAVVTPAIDSARLFELLVDLARVKEVRQSTEYVRATDPERAPMGIGVIGADGWVGMTAVAVNVAVAIAREYPGDVVLFEAVPHGAEAADVLSLEPKSSLSELAELGVEGIDPDTVEASLVVHGSGLRLLPGDDTGDPRWPELLSVEILAQILAILRRRFRNVVVAVPHLLWQGSAYLLRRCEHVLVVTRLATELDARMAARMVKALSDANIPLAKMILVASRVRRTDAVTPSEIAQWTGVPECVALPDDPKLMEEAYRRGTAIVERGPTAPLAQALISLAQRLASRRAKAA